MILQEKDQSHPIRNDMIAGEESLHGSYDFRDHVTRPQQGRNQHFPKRPACSARCKSKPFRRHAVKPHGASRTEQSALILPGHLHEMPFARFAV